MRHPPPCTTPSCVLPMHHPHECQPPMCHPHEPHATHPMQTTAHMALHSATHATPHSATHPMQTTTHMALHSATHATPNNTTHPMQITTHMAPHSATHATPHNVTHPMQTTAHMASHSATHATPHNATYPMQITTHMAPHNPGTTHATHPTLTAGVSWQGKTERAWMAWHWSAEEEGEVEIAKRAKSHEYSDCTDRLLETMSFLLTAVYEARRGNVDAREVEKALKAVKSKKEDLRKEIDGRLYLVLKKLRSERKALWKWVGDVYVQAQV